MSEELGRREFFGWAGRRTAGVALAGASLSAFVAACARDDAEPTATARDDGSEALVADVIDYALTSEEWAGTFGFVTFKLHQAAFDGDDVYFIRTDASDADFAGTEGLVHVPKLAELITPELYTKAYVVSGGVAGQPVVLSSEPGRDDYTPAFRLYQASWTGQASELRSVADVEAAEAAGDLSVDATDTVVNYPVVKWSSGEMSVDTERTGYLGPGQLLEAPDTDAMQVTFKLHECYPLSRYIVTDVGGAPMAENMNIVHSPGLVGTVEAGGTGRVNVFMGGVEGPGPMGGQPSVFDSTAGASVWSPYWEHWTYAWEEGATGEVLRTQDKVHEARDAGDVTEFPGTPNTGGNTFVVNCPVPVRAPNTWEPAS